MKKCKHLLVVLFVHFHFSLNQFSIFVLCFHPSHFVYLFISSTFFGVCHFDFHDGTASAAQTCSLLQCSVVNVIYGFISKLSPLKPILQKRMFFSERICFTFQDYVYTFHYLKHAFKHVLRSLNVQQIRINLKGFFPPLCQNTSLRKTNKKKT